MSGNETVEWWSEEILKISCLICTCTPPTQYDDVFLFIRRTTTTPWWLQILAFCSEHPKWNQNPYWHPYKRRRASPPISHRSHPPWLQWHANCGGQKAGFEIATKLEGVSEAGGMEGLRGKEIRALRVRNNFNKYYLYLYLLLLHLMTNLELSSSRTRLTFYTHGQETGKVPNRQ